MLLSNILLQNWGAGSWHPGPSPNPVSLCRGGQLGWLPLLTLFLFLPYKPGYILHLLLSFKERNLVCPYIYLTCWFYFWVSFGNLVLFFFFSCHTFFPCQVWTILSDQVMGNWLSFCSFSLIIMQNLIQPPSFLCPTDFQTWSYSDIFIGSKAIVMVLHTICVPVGFLLRWR